MSVGAVITSKCRNGPFGRFYHRMMSLSEGSLVKTVFERFFGNVDGFFDERSKIGIQICSMRFLSIFSKLSDFDVSIFAISMGNLLEKTPTKNLLQYRVASAAYCPLVISRCFSPAIRHSHLSVASQCRGEKRMIVS